MAGGPDEWSNKRLHLWRKEVLFDLDIKCSGTLLTRANRVDLAVYSGYFHTLFESQFPDADKKEVNIEGAEPAVLESIIRALYEKEVWLRLWDEHLIERDTETWKHDNGGQLVLATACGFTFKPILSFGFPLWVQSMADHIMYATSRVLCNA